MAVQHGLHVLAAAAVTAGVLTGWFTRARRNNGHGASAARAPWRRTAPAPAGAGAGHEPARRLPRPDRQSNAEDSRRAPRPVLGEHRPALPALGHRPRQELTAAAVWAGALGRTALPDPSRLGRGAATVIGHINKALAVPPGTDGLRHRALGPRAESAIDVAGPAICRNDQMGRACAERPRSVRPRQSVHVRSSTAHGAPPTSTCPTLFASGPPGPAPADRSREESHRCSALLIHPGPSGRAGP